MAIVRKSVITGTERKRTSTVLEIALMDYNEIDPPGSQQVGQSVVVTVKDKDNKNTEEFLDSILEKATEDILKTIKKPTLEDIAKGRMRGDG